MREETITADSWDHAEITYLRHWSYPVALIQVNHSSFLSQAQLLFFSRHDHPKGKSTVIVEIVKEKWSFQKQFSWLPYKGKECWAKTSIITIMDFICAETNYRSNEEIGQPLSFLDSIKTSVPRKLTQNKRHGYRKHQQPRCTTQIIQRIPLGICKEGSPYFAIWHNINIQGGTWPVTRYSHNSSKHNMAVDSKGTRR